MDSQAREDHRSSRDESSTSSPVASAIGHAAGANAGGAIQVLGESAAPNENALQRPNDGEKEDSPPELEISDIPSTEDIYKYIPTEGIDIRKLASNFRTKLDATNEQLFVRVVRAIANVETVTIVKPLSRLPSEAEVQKLIKDARTPPQPRPPKIVGEITTITSRLVGPTKISFSEPEELVRAESNRRPDFLFRTFYENSTTLSYYVNPHNDGKHREKPHLHLRDGLAFQSYGDFVPIKDLNRQRIERHLIWNQKRDPSSYISAFDDLDLAIERARFHYRESQRIGYRVSIAKISAKVLVAATVRGELEETVSIKFKNAARKWETRISTTARHVEIPVWVHEDAKPTDGSAISLENMTASGLDMWLSIAELRLSNLKVPAKKGNSYEWLACGTIPKSRVSRVMPFDGRSLHEVEGTETVKSLESQITWIYNWSKWMWFHDTEAQSRKEEDGSLNKRKRTEDDQDGDESSESRQHKHQRLDTADRNPPRDELEHSERHCPTCTCGHRRNPSSQLHTSSDSTGSLD